ncbi:Hexapeptide repeat of succinyl-transferase [Zunongwangia mangrovi]|uniref:Hexapeptide repeat of succinyl-transferase n=1 Tax=Zunongwangia mangrovi TaxID=1334022 RepID=A0A1I1D481_9FLAO|nr:acyltransferase [Zunongwangia mangrovi]SFB69829.1 Hexapeptide repeat of succinyl-transferase [Zunongwangia mangrovi]
MEIKLLFKLIFKSLRKVSQILVRGYDKLMCYIIFTGNGASFGKFKSTGFPYMMIARTGNFTVDENFSMHNRIDGNPIGVYEKCTFFVGNKAKINIGKSVGISQAAIICHELIHIGDNVKIGGGVKIYDSDFHSVDPIVRNSELDLVRKKNAPVYIDDNVFIGAQSIILKGVKIGKNSIIGAGSVVTKSIPSNQIWAGNPARFIKNIS